MKDKVFQNLDYPAIYRASDNASIKAQKSYLLAIRIHLFLLIFSAGLSVYGINNKNSAILAALLITGSVFISFGIYFKKDEDSWYRTRAIAESVKTTTWRFIMCTEPFRNDEEINYVKSIFNDRLRAIIDEHKDLGDLLGGEVSSHNQITSKMLYVRNLSLTKRVEFYRKYRIDQQRMWYAKKSKEAKENGKFWFKVLIVCQLVSIFFVILRVAYPSFKFLPTEIFLVGAASVITWIQVKRFRELSASYGLTAHELGFIRGELESVEDEGKFSEFVDNSENAFSREHTQWLARKNII